MDGFEELWQELFGEQKDLSRSFNYQLCCNYLPKCFFGSGYSVYALCDEPPLAKIFISTAVSLTERHSRLPIPKAYEDLPIKGIENGKFRGIVVELPDAQYECECKFVALLDSQDGERKYYTGEYYQAEKKFGVCSFAANMSHTAHVWKVETLEEFVEAIGFRFL